MRRGFKFVSIIFLILAIWVFTAPWLASRLIVESPLEHADAIMVLSGSAAYKERTLKAAELYKLGVATRIFITNDGERAGWSQDEQRNPPYVELEQRELIANGVPFDAITVLPGEVAGTEWEAKALVREVDAHPVSSVLLVTSQYHTRRALWIFERFLAGKNVEVGIERSPPGEWPLKPETWWLHKSGWQTIGGEYVKSVAYYFYYH